MQRGLPVNLHETSDEVVDGCLLGLRVLDLTDESGQLAGRILADLGADVLKVEAPGGDAARRCGPFLTGAEELGGVGWIAANAGKRSVVLDLPADPAPLVEFARHADVLIESFSPGFLEGIGLGFRALREINSRLIVCSITPYGQSGPLRDRRASDLTIMAAGGNLFPVGDVDRPPVRCSAPLTHCHAGAEAAVGILMALWHRDATGQGQHVDVSRHETMMVTNLPRSAQSWRSGEQAERSGPAGRVGDLLVREVWRCKDGFVAFSPHGGPGRDTGLKALTRELQRRGLKLPASVPGDLDSSAVARMSQEQVDAMSATIAEYFLATTRHELNELARTHDVALAPVNAETELLESRQLQSRGFIVDVPDAAAQGGFVRLPSTFVNWPRAEVRGLSPAPDSGRDGFLPGPGFAPPIWPTASDGRGVYAGLKILEFGAGPLVPLATRYFADQGAIIVKVEAVENPDCLRLLGGDGPAAMDKSLFFNVLNCNRFSVALRMRDPRAGDLARRLVEWADVVVENWPPDVMLGWGLDYERMVEIQPRLVMLSASLWGQTGPERGVCGTGPLWAALAGYDHLTGWPDREPLPPLATVTESLSPRFAAVAIAAALLHRERTGEGSYLDLSQVEVGAYCLSDWLLAYQATGRSTARNGNRSQGAAPHGVFPAAGEESWIALAVHSDEDWSRLRAVVGDPLWCDSPEFRTAEARLRNVDVVEQAVAAWTSQQPAEDLVRRLQKAGIDAAPVDGPHDVTRNAQLISRGHFQTIQHPVIGEHVVQASGLRLSESPPRLWKAASCLGEDAEYVFCDILRMPTDLIRDLIRDGALVVPARGA